ncbi:extracellular solute-binding protein [Planomonospora parontospora]|uniref:extracellular solute-binding protein n=1 Tax=Planomonospora parontospora TaxID=58119 RepID=UPI0019963CF9|nr:extracellular solute-binding protein [Planomonospora parontospora]GGL13099.1 lipoprotein LipO [Planomonospora parontospora subsp. antibiotica]GII13959.1 lipoprotein LipO [Planomonospora parontospora subsp. antibiotica]
MKTTPRRLLAGTVALTTALLAAACGSDDAGQQAASNELTMMVPLFGTAPDPKGEVQQAVEKVVGKKLKISWVPNAEYGDKTNVVLASDKIPQVMVVQSKTAAFVQAAQAGAFWELTDKLDKYPNLKAKSEQSELNASINGKVFGIYRVRPLLRSAVLYRKDWLDRLDLKVPETVDELYEVAKAFTEKDPDGNGKKDTYGLIIPKWPTPVFCSSSPYNVIETWFGAPNCYGDRGGKLTPAFDTEEFYTANRWLKKLVDEGLVNPDFATLDSGKWNDPFYQGKGGIIIDVNVRASQMYGLLKEQDPENYGDKLAMGGNLKRSDGQKFSQPFDGYNGFLAISKQSVRTEAELDDVLKSLDRLATKEGQALLANGIEGRNFKLENGFDVPINDTDPAVKTINNDVDFAFIQLGTWATIGMGVYEQMPTNEAERENLRIRKELVELDLQTAVHNPALPIVSPAYVSKGAVLDPIVSDARVKFLAGEITEEQLRAEVKRWHESGGDQVVAEINDLHAKLGGN